MCMPPIRSVGVGVGILAGKSFGCVYSDVECKNISIFSVYEHCSVNRHKENY